MSIETTVPPLNIFGTTTLPPEAFRDFGERIRLARLGHFSSDTPEHRFKRYIEAREAVKLEHAYHEIGMDRQDECEKIRRELEGRTGGIRATSTAEYYRRRDALDAWVLETVKEGGL